MVNGSRFVEPFRVDVDFDLFMLLFFCSLFLTPSVCLDVGRRMEAELGSLGYLVASGHMLVLSEFCEKLLLHALVMTGRFV